MSAFLKTSTFGLVVSFCLACSSPRESLYENAYYLTESEFSIKHGTNIISNQFLFTKLIGKDSLLYFEQKDRDFYLFDLKTHELKRFLGFGIAGPNFIDSQILDFERIGDHYIILTSNYINICDKNGQIIKRKAINRFQDNMDDSSISRTHQFQVKDKSKLYLAQSPRAVLAPLKDINTNLSIIAVYNIENDSTTYLPVYSPEETLIEDNTRGYYGSDAEHNLLLMDNSIIFSFDFSPSIYKYTLDSKQIDRFDGKTEAFPEGAKPFPANKYRDTQYLVKHKALNGTHFSKLEYNEENNIFIRFA